ncbi:hypothetical protein [Caminibacter sp.]
MANKIVEEYKSEFNLDDKYIHNNNKNEVVIEAREDFVALVKIAELDEKNPVVVASF